MSAKDIEITRYQKINSHLNITPLIDVVLLLLIFFMLSSSFIVQQGIKICLPQAAPKKIVATQKEILIYITKTNDIFFNSKPIDLNELKNKISQKLPEQKNKNVIIKADEKVNLGLVVKIMDISQEAGAKELVIATQEK